MMAISHISFDSQYEFDLSDMRERALIDNDYHYMLP